MKTSIRSVIAVVAAILSLSVSAADARDYTSYVRLNTQSVTALTPPDDMGSSSNAKSYLVPSGETLTVTTDSKANYNQWYATELAVAGVYEAACNGDARNPVLPPLAILPGGMLRFSANVTTLTNSNNTVEIRGTLAEPSVIKNTSLGNGASDSSCYPRLFSAFSGGAENAVKFVFENNDTTNVYNRAFRVKNGCVGFRDFYGMVIVDGPRTWLRNDGSNSPFDVGGTLAVINGANVFVNTESSPKINRLEMSRNTTFKVGNNSVITVGDAVLDGANFVFNPNKADMFCFTNSLTVKRPVKLDWTSPLVSDRKAVVSLPVGKGVLNPQDFLYEPSAYNERYERTVEIEDGVQYLYITRCRNLDSTADSIFKDAEFSVNSSSAKGVLTNAQAWSDHQLPHSDKDYCWTNYFQMVSWEFNGRSLLLDAPNDKTWMRFAVDKQNNIYTHTIADLRVKSTNGTFVRTDGTNTVYELVGKMSILSKLSDRFPFRFAVSVNGQKCVTHQTFYGSSGSAFMLSRDITSTVPEGVAGSVEFIGDLSAYFGTMIVNTNFTARLGGTVKIIPGTIRLAASSAQVETMAPDGAEINLGTLEATVSSAISVASTNTLTVMDGFSLGSGVVLTKTGAGVLASCATNNINGTILVQQGSLRADEVAAFDGVALQFASDGTCLIDCAAEGDLAEYGILTSAGVSSSVGDPIVVTLENFNREIVSTTVNLFTVPTANAETLALPGALRIVGIPKGFAAEMSAVDSGISGMKTVQAKVIRHGFILSFR